MPLGCALTWMSGEGEGLSQEHSSRGPTCPGLPASTCRSTSSREAHAGGEEPLFSHGFQELGLLAHRYSRTREVGSLCAAKVLHPFK